MYKISLILISYADILTIQHAEKMRESLDNSTVQKVLIIIREAGTSTQSKIEHQDRSLWTKLSPLNYLLKAQNGEFALKF